METINSVVHLPPTPVAYSKRSSVFLAGTIDNGNSVDWQTQVSGLIGDLDIDIVNPRRDDWDSSWDEVKSDPQFHEQVSWEMYNLDRVDTIFLYLVPGSVSPISLLELGMHASDFPIVVCPEGYWRKGNVDMVADKFGFIVYDTLEEGTRELRRRIECAPLK